MDPKIKILSPLDPRAKLAPTPLDNIPLSVVKGLIHGLLTHLWNDKRYRTKEVEDVLEKRLVECVRQVVLNSPAATDEQLLKGFEDTIPQIFKMVLKHNYFVFVAQSDLILPRLSCYKKIITYAKRLKWLRQEVPDLLTVLKQGLLCTECRGNTRVPDESKLAGWACSASVGGLRNNVLAYFHDGMEPSTVKKILSTR
jgi:hypothetical protein